MMLVYSRWCFIQVSKAFPMWFNLHIIIYSFVFVSTNSLLLMRGKTSDKRNIKKCRGPTQKYGCLLKTPAIYTNRKLIVGAPKVNQKQKTRPNRIKSYSHLFKSSNLV